MTRRRTVRVEDILRQRVRAAGGRVVGRIEEIRVDRRGGDYYVTEYRLGAGALFERFGLLRRWFGRKPVTLVARWDQIDISRADRPQLLCAPEELKHE